MPSTRAAKAKYQGAIGVEAVADKATAKSLTIAKTNQP